MTYALVRDGVLIQYPYSLEDLRRDNPRLSLPLTLPSFKLAEYGMLPVLIAERPTQAMDETAVLSETPELVEGQWVLGWTVRAKTPEEVAAERQKMRARVNAERARRLVAGTKVTVTGNGPVALSGRDEDTRNLQGLAFAAQLRLADGNTTHQTTFRDAENVDHVLTPAQVLEMWSLGSAWIEQVYAASWALKDTQGGIPADYANDGYWPQ
ncbi:hypothetical protein TM1040_1654 [Ruegeria sp. TM1040]|uniref:DUF4376 domain-containing protein n=1 Tax=Ruegeria sp. (strain TM1040) TaxID=292414 RepID=UPI0000462375|nr:DUF4376 domain-containing protein [Ruegeria sp. TM1040]ABF64387.1 hypothetical protein TM1040_1654 [Ruegeria sp. TM1040]